MRILPYVPAVRVMVQTRLFHRSLPTGRLLRLQLLSAALGLIAAASLALSLGSHSHHHQSAAGAAAG